jgi:hypothetical protein
MMLELHERAPMLFSQTVVDVGIHGSHSALPPTPSSAQVPLTAWHCSSHAMACPVPTDGVALFLPRHGVPSAH